MSPSLQSPINYPVAFVGGVAFTARLSFGAIRRLQMQAVDLSIPLKPPTPEEGGDAMAAYVQASTARECGMAAAMLVDARGLPIDVSGPPSTWAAQIEVRLFPHEFGALDRALIEAVRLAEEMRTQAAAATASQIQTLPQTTQ